MRTSTLRRMTAAAMTVALAISGGTAAVAQGSTGAAAQVPAAVLKAFQQTYPGAVISAAAPARDRGRAVFRIESVDKGRRRVVLYDTGATAVEIAEYVEEKELPRPVADAMHSHPRAIFVSGMKVTRGSDVEYRLTLRGTRKTAMVAKPDGTVISFK